MRDEWKGGGGSIAYTVCSSTLPLQLSQWISCFRHIEYTHSHIHVASLCISAISVQCMPTDSYVKCHKLLGSYSTHTYESCFLLLYRMYVMFDINLQLFDALENSVKT